MTKEKELSYEEWKAQIEAQIAALTAELEGLLAVQTYANEAGDAIDCISSKLAASSDLFKKAGTIGGIPLDKGKASQRANQLSKISLDVRKISSDLAPRIAELEAEIARLESLI